MGRDLPYAATRFKRPRPQRRDRWFLPAIVALPLAAFTAVFFGGGPPKAEAIPRANPSDTERANFAICGGGARMACVIDGDTIWYRGEKIRIADINTPEVSEPECAEEAELGSRATLRLQALLNQGPFALEPNPDGRETDRYGRSLKLVTRDGESLGDELVEEGLAESWHGYRGSWC